LARRLLWLVTLAVAAAVAGGFVAVAALAVVAAAALAVVAAGGFVAMVVVVTAVVAPTASAHPESMPHLAQVVVAVVAVVVDWQTAPWTRATGAAIRSTEAAAAPLGQDTTSQQISSGA
jgi:hypothetical protein